MLISICSFTSQGSQLQKKIAELCTDCCVFEKPQNQNLNLWVKNCFENHLPIIFIGAAGIAVRSIAPFVTDKLTDSPVVVIDEKARFVIPVLSGHAGGGNALARTLAEKLGAQAVITTATDVEEKFSVDVFAVKNGLKIINREGIRLVSGKILKGQKIKIWIQQGISCSNFNIPEEVEILPTASTSSADVCIALDAFSPSLPESLLYLQPQTLCLGMGCKKDKSFEELLAFVKASLTQEQLEQLCCLSSIDIKQKEPGLNMLACFLKVPFYTYSAEQLKNAFAEGFNFSESEFVEQTTGVTNVCERAAVCAGENSGRMLVKKTVQSGMTLALFQKNPSISTWETK